MVIERLRYPVRYYHEPGETRFTVWIPDINSNGIGIYTQGETLAEARVNAQEALTGCLLTKLDVGVPLDQPGQLPAEDGWEWVSPELPVQVALLLRELRHRHGLTQEDVAERIGVPYTTYQRWENPDKCNATLKTLDRVASAYGKTVELCFR